MNLSGKPYVVACTTEELEKLAKNDKESLKSITKDKRKIGELQRFIKESQAGAANLKRELVANHRFSFIVYYAKVSPGGQSQQEVKISKDTVLHFFGEDYFTFDEGDHSWVVNMRTGEVRYRHNRVATHVLAHSPATHQRLN